MADMERLIERGLLYDYYGGLLGEKNKRIYEACAVDDMSLAEIAEEVGVSRQAVSETLKRTDAKLQGYEKELGLIKKSGLVEKTLGDIRDALAADEVDKGRILELLDEIEGAI